MKKLFVLSVLLIILTVLAITAVILIPYRDRSLDIVLHERPMRIGYAVEPPFAYIDQNSGVTGVDPELARHIARNIGINKLEWVLLDFGSLIPAIEAKQIDMIAAGMFITSGRTAHVDFSVPTLRVTQGLLVGRGNPFSIHSYRTLVSLKNIKVAVLSGSFEEDALIGAGIERERLYPVAVAETGRMSVCEGLAAAFALSAPSIRWMGTSRSRCSCDIADPLDTDGIPDNFTGFAFQKSASSLRCAWDAQLREFIGSAGHRELIGRFGLTGNELPEDRESSR